MRREKVTTHGDVPGVLKRRGNEEGERKAERKHAAERSKRAQKER